MENHLYECINDIIRSDAPEATKYVELKRYKAQIVLMHTIRTQKIMVEVSENDKRKMKRYPYTSYTRQCEEDTRTIRHVRDSDGNVIERPQDIPNIYLLNMREKFRTIEIDNESVHRLQSFIQQQDPMEGECLNVPITLDEVSEEIRAGARNKAPGIDGISLVLHR
jgi:hypothetical protein